MKTIKAARVLIICGVILLLPAFVYGIILLSSIISNNAVYVRDTDLWERAILAKVTGINSRGSVIEYSYITETHRIEVPGIPPVGTAGKLIVYYNPDDLAEVSITWVFGWVATPNARVAATSNNSYILEYDILEKTTSVLKGRRGNSERIGSTVTAYYEIANPSNVFRETVNFQEFLGYGSYLVFGFIFLFRGIWVKRLIKKEEVQ